MLVCVNIDLYDSLELSLGCKLLYLPPYSPDFNPIEECFSSIKAWLRRNKDEVNTAFDSMWPLMLALETVTAEKAWGWYKDSGYI